jgi:mRNA interferase HigB
MQVLDRVLIDSWKKSHQSTQGVAKALDVWMLVVEAASWTVPQDVNTTFNSADIIGSNNGKTLIVFDIKGNKFRLVAKINFQLAFVFPIDFLNHTDYSKKCPITLGQYP